MIIRRSQLTALEQEVIANFEARAVAHLRESLTDITAGRTDAELLSRIRSTIVRARRYWLTSEQETIAFLDASFFLGGDDFDADPRHSWAAALLNDERYTPREKAALLLDRAFDFHAGRLGQAEK
jgi:hypothetical protein